MPAWKPQKYDLFSFFKILSLVGGLETTKYLQLEAIGDKIESQFAFDSKIKGKNIFEATSCNCKETIIWSQLFRHQWQNHKICVK